MKHDYTLRAMVTGREKPVRKPVPAHIAAMANAVLNQLDTGDLDRQAVRAVCEWVSIQRNKDCRVDEQTATELFNSRFFGSYAVVA